MMMGLIQFGISLATVWHPPPLSTPLVSADHTTQRHALCITFGQ